MKLSARPILRLKPVIVGLTLFSFMWVVVREANRTYRFYEDTSGFWCTHCPTPPDGEQIFVALLLVVASLVLLIKDKTSYVITVILSGFSFYRLVFVSLWWDAHNAEVPILSSKNMVLWWQDMREGYLLQIILASFLFCYSMFSVIRLIRGHRNLPMSNNTLDRTRN